MRTSSKQFNKGGKIMKLKLTVLIAAGVVALGLVLGTSAAQAAEEVIFDQNDNTRAVEIRDLDINGTLYNVTFSNTNTTAAEVYGPFPGTFDFDTVEGAEDAVIAMIPALQNNGALTVGVEGSGEAPFFRVGFGSDTILGGIQAVAFWEGGRGDGDLQTEPWLKAPDPDADSYPLGVRLWALFTLASEPPDAALANAGLLPAVSLLLNPDAARLFPVTAGANKGFLPGAIFLPLLLN